MRIAIARFAFFCLFALSVCIAGAQTAPVTLHSFAHVEYRFRNPDGAFPLAGLLQSSDGNFYGTAEEGGHLGYGTIYRMSPSGVLAVLYTFGFGPDGGYPVCRMIEASDGSLYGGSNGTVFRIVLGGGAPTFQFFQLPAGANVRGITQAKDGNLYGVADGGLYGSGEVFSMNNSGQFNTLYSFTGGADGSDPLGGLIQATDGYLYGLCNGGGANGTGALFRISTSGAFAVAHSFGPAGSAELGGNADGEYPQSVLIQGTDGRLYGTARYGGTHGSGTIFAMDLSGNFTTLYSFHSGNNNLDGNYPDRGLVQASDGNYYGAAFGGGQHALGTLFRITAAGSFTTLYNIKAGGPVDGNELIQGADGNLYGTAIHGGQYNAGSIFRFPLPAGG